MKRKKLARSVCTSAIIAALYVGLTYLSGMLGLSSGVIQLRFSEALCVLPAFTVHGIGGLFVGCLLSNLLLGSVALDIIFGSIATLLGAVGTYLIGKKNPLLAVIPPIVANTAIIPFVLTYAYGAEDAMWFIFLTVGIGEVISAGVLGFVLWLRLNKTKSNFNIFK